LLIIDTSLVTIDYGSELSTKSWPVQSASSRHPSWDGRSGSGKCCSCLTPMQPFAAIQQWPLTRYAAVRD